MADDVAMRPFNRPRSFVGKLAFAFLARLEAGIAKGSSVGVTPFFEESQFPWLEGVKAYWPQVQREAIAILERQDALPAIQEISPQIGYITQDRHWRTLMLLGYGMRSERGLRQCPQTARLLQRIPGVRTAFFSILEPGKKLPPHRGPYNGVLRLHLGLIVPQPVERCWIRVGHERRHWREGEALIFDDAYEHEVHNDTDGVRVVLFVDFERPCRPPARWLNRAVLFAARFTPFMREALRNQRRWERAFYADRAAAGATEHASAGRQ